ncbi:MAG: hypothetical protein ACO25B_00340 [Chitinophagaceae bacterium]
MKKHRAFFIPAFLGFVMGGHVPPHKHSHVSSEGPGFWTGTLTLEEKYTGITGWGERKMTVTFSNAQPTLYREVETTDLNFTDNKGTGSHTHHGEEIIGGKKISITDCQGSGPSELHAVVINEEDNVYDIEAIAPACTGTTLYLLDGSSTVYGPEETSIIVSNEPLLSRDVLSGSKSETKDLPGDLGTVTYSMSWHLTRNTEYVNLIVTPEDYDDWLPEPGQDETSKGNEINIDLELTGGNTPSTNRVKHFELSLVGTSSEPGIALNMPRVVPPGNSQPDLRFLPQPNTILGLRSQTATVKSLDGKTGKIAIGAFDGGAYCEMIADAILENGRKIQGHLLVAGGETNILIPKRSRQSHIGAAWVNANNNPGDIDDEEISLGNQYRGDGLSAYEEYRGVISKGAFQRLDPMKKELGVKMNKTEHPLFSEGIKKFENASDLKVIPFFETEIGADRMLNKHFKTANVYKQYALFLQQGVLTGDLGKSFGGPATPLQVSKTVIDQNRIRLSYNDRLSEARSMNVTLSYTENDLFATVTAHELSHSVNVQHHGSQPSNSIRLEVLEGRPVHIYDVNRMEITTRPYLISGRAGEPGNEQSGDVQCFMLNNALYDWSVRINTTPWLFYQVPLIPLGLKLCTSKDGTGLNSLKDSNGNFIYFGDATNGNCLGNIKLRN